VSPGPGTGETGAWPGPGLSLSRGATRNWLPWPRAQQTVGGVRYLRPEIALLYKARLDRPKDRADLAAAALDADARAWLAANLERLGHHEWAHRARDSRGAG